jgi:hypothetical protein
VDVTKECDFLKSVRKEEAIAEVPEKLGYARGKGGGLLSFTHQHCQ